MWKTRNIQSQLKYDSLNTLYIYTYETKLFQDLEGQTSTSKLIVRVSQNSLPEPTPPSLTAYVLTAKYKIEEESLDQNPTVVVESENPFTARLDGGNLNNFSRLNIYYLLFIKSTY